MSTPLKRNRKALNKTEEEPITHRTALINSLQKIVSLSKDENVKSSMELIMTILDQLVTLGHIDSYKIPNLVGSNDLTEQLQHCNKDDMFLICMSNINLSLELTANSKDYNFLYVFDDDIKNLKPLIVDNSNDFLTPLDLINKQMFMIIKIIITQMRLICTKYRVYNLIKNEEYEVEAILGRKVENSKVKYLIKWKGYDDSDNSWEPRENLGQCTELIEAFHGGAAPLPTP